MDAEQYRQRRCAEIMRDCEDACAPFVKAKVALAMWKTTPMAWILADGTIEPIPIEWTPEEAATIKNLDHVMGMIVKRRDEEIEKLWPQAMGK